MLHSVPSFAFTRRPWSTRTPFSRTASSSARSRTSALAPCSARGPSSSRKRRCSVRAASGEGNVVYPHVTLGAPPQDRTWSGEPTDLVIGDDNQFRESVTVHRGTAKGGGVTRIGSHCLLMVGAHVAHDCTVADGVTLTNNTSLGGHVVVGRRAVIGGHVAVAPFVTIGELSFAAGGAMIERDVPPYVIVAGDRARVRALNRVGLLRAEVPGSVPRAALERLSGHALPLRRAASRRRPKAARAEHGVRPVRQRRCSTSSRRALPRT